jgi:hypothetical protein
MKNGQGCKIMEKKISDKSIIYNGWMNGNIPSLYPKLKNMNLEINYKSSFEKFINKITSTMNKKLIYDFDTKPFVRFIRSYYNNKKLTGCEVGVCHGDNAFNMVNKLNIEKLYLVDSFELYDDYKNWVIGNTQGYYNKVYNELIQRMKPFGDKVEILKMFSNEAYKKFDDKSLDFIYIDTNHCYNYIYKDFLNWYSKIKVDGIFGGHGFDANWSLCFAIVDICRKFDLICMGCNSDWWIIKK